VAHFLPLLALSRRPVPRYLLRALLEGGLVYAGDSAAVALADGQALQIRDGELAIFVEAEDPNRLSWCLLFRLAETPGLTGLGDDAPLASHGVKHDKLTGGGSWYRASATYHRVLPHKDRWTS
jgi:hypothetical protein